MAYHLLSAESTPVWYIEDGHKPSIGDEPILALYQALQPVNGKRWIAFRVKPIDRLPGIMANGVDVNPTDTTIFCAEEDYFSRLADQGNTAYEYAYGYWIPGNAKDALLAIFLRGTVNEVMEALSPHG